MYFSLPLAFNVTSEIFQAIRETTSKGIGASTDLALSAACTIVAIQLIKLSYDVMSDEQQGGFGGIRLWQVLRPIIIILAINLSSTLFGWFNYGVNYFASAISSSYNATTCKTVVDAQLRAMKSEVLGEYAGNEKVEQGYEMALGADQAGKKAYNDYISSINTAAVNTASGSGFGLSTSQNSAGMLLGAWFNKLVTKGKQKREATKLVKEGITEVEKSKIDDGVADIVGDSTLSPGEIDGKTNAVINGASYVGEVKSSLEKDGEDFVKSIKDGSLFLKAAFWFYDLAFFVLNAMVEIFLSILTVMFPWTLVLSLFSHFKDATWKYIATYINISFWKVTAAIINWAVTTSIPAMAIYTAKKLLPNMANQSFSTKIGAIAGNGLATGMVLVAGFICLTKVASITNMYIPNASVDSMAADSVMGIASTAGHTAVSTVTQAPGKVATVGVGKVAAAGAAGAGKSVTNAMGKVAGGATP